MHFLDIFLSNSASADSWNMWSIACKNLTQLRIAFSVSHLNFAMHCSLDLFMNLYNDGTITVTPPAILTTTCVVNMNEFPYDKKECLLQFGRQVL